MGASTYCHRKAGTVRSQPAEVPFALLHTEVRLIAEPCSAVYGRENRLKVSQDEAKHEEEQRGKRQKHEQVWSQQHLA